MTNKLRELGEEFRTVVLGRGNLVDTVVPPVVFLVVNAAAGFDWAMGSALALALIIGAVRLMRRQSWLYALGGVGGVVLAILVARLLDRAEGFFLPSMVTGVLTIVACLLSVVVRRPLVAWTSYIARRWPLSWYWHPRVRPAYAEVTLVWGLFFVARLALQLALFWGAQADALAVVSFLAGWPATILLLVASYLYGTWRLAHLKGPSVEEYTAGVEPPWTGQQRGF